PATLIPDLAGARSQIESHIEVLNKYVVAQQWPLQRMQVMKHLASREFGIPPTRFCDYIVQFSPEIYNKRIRKYVKNWEEILETIDAEHPMDRMKALMAENKSIYADIYKRRLYQEQILTFKDLHQHIHDFAREHSTSASIKNYVKALSAVAATVMKSYQGESFVRSPLYTIVCKKLEFLYYKQRVHPGFDLHRAAIQLFKLDTQRHDSICSRSSDHVDMLERFHVGANGAFVSHEEHKAHSELQNLAAMFMDMIEILSANREELIANFKDAYLRWIGREDESVDFQSSHYILTHGYSRTVRETIKYGLRPLIAESDSHNRPRVYIIKSSDEDAIDTRLMEFELRQNVLNENEGQSPLEIMSADESVLLDLFGPHSHVLLVLGTEAYDQKCHVIHPRGIRLRELRTAIQKTGAHCTVMIVAEGYKCHDNLLEIQEFYQHHLDRIAINGAGQVDEVVSTNGLGIRNNLSDIHPKGYHNGVPVS
ncbi:MAG: hypothetical protein KDE53_39450, partial [Caldilineaceae bacterium]|nr:hypothetical protein [Caldilineaceae bacterium]